MKRNLQTGRKQTSTLLDHILEPCEKTVPLTVQNSHNAAADADDDVRMTTRKQTPTEPLKLQDCNREQQQQSVCFLVNDAVQY